LVIVVLTTAAVICLLCHSRQLATQ